MLWSASGIKGYAITASDGEIGTVSDFLFDDDSWLVRWLVVDTKNWCPGKKVLISPASAPDANWTDGLLNLSVDRQNVKSSPAYNETMATDRDYERRFHNHFGDINTPGQT